MILSDHASQQIKEHHQEPTPESDSNSDRKQSSLNLDMKFILSTHNVAVTTAIEDHILAKIEKLEHLDQKAIEARVNIERDQTKGPDKQYKCAIRLGVRGPDLFAEDYEDDLYKAIDLVTKKIEQQIRKLHSKKKAKVHSAASKDKLKRQEASLD